MDVAVQNAMTLARFFRTQAPRFLAIIRGDVDPAEHARRPAIRFNGETLEANEPWPNAQNDALGYFLWFYCRLARSGAIASHAIDWDVLALFPPYLQAITYWKDEDSGHWEEQPKISASSIGAVVAGLRELAALLDSSASDAGLTAALHRDLTGSLSDEGTRALAAILPAECVQFDPSKERRFDAALLFLIFPLDVVDETMADRIITDIRTHLQGEVGIRRYLGDSFWCADYKRKLTPQQRTSDWSMAVAERNALCAPGEEAEWCLFDPLLAIIFGDRFRRWGGGEWSDLHAHHLNRSLGQLTGADSGFAELRCPELYYREAGARRASDATPLLWTQALLWLALRRS